MKAALGFLLVSLAATAAAWHTQMLSLCLLAGWVAVCYFWVSLAFLQGRPALLLKRPDGRLAWIAGLLLLPYRAYIRLWILVWTQLVREPAWHQVAPGLYLGRMLTPRDQPAFRLIRWAGVLDLTAELQAPDFIRRRPDYLALPTLDMTSPAPAAFERGVQFIRQHLPQGNVYVHCALGHGRSATLVVAYLAAAGLAPNPVESVKQLRAQRRGVWLTGHQWQGLEDFLKKQGKPGLVE